MLFFLLHKPRLGRVSAKTKNKQVGPMLEIRNKTPFSAMLVPSLDKHGHNYAVMIVKGTFKIHAQGASLVMADEQQAPLQNDVFYGEAGKSSVKYESDISPVKRAVDLVLNGHAYAPGGRAISALDASLQIGRYKKSIRVFGDRTWQKHHLRWEQTPPVKFERMRLVYENSFGGVAPRESEESPVEFCRYNPLGKGFAGTDGKGLKLGLALPNLEDPTQLIQYWDDCPAPVGVGFICRNWAPRLMYAGAYDEQWKKDRMPLLPQDFDDRYYNGAQTQLMLSSEFELGETVELIHFSEQGSLKFRLPRYRVVVTALIKGKPVTHVLAMDTIVIEPDDMRVFITWRHAIPCKNQFLYIDNVTVDWESV